MLKKEHGKDEERVAIRSVGGREQRVALIADGYFILRHVGRRAHFFIEVDRSTVSNKRWMQKVRAYMAYYRSGQYQARYQTRSLRVLTVTTSQKRLANLKAATEQTGAGPMFWFTTFDLVNTENVLSTPIWQVAGGQGNYALIEPTTPPPVSPPV